MDACINLFQVFKRTILAFYVGMYKYVNANK